MEILTTAREHFGEKLDSIDNDINKWPEEKELSKDYKNNIQNGTKTQKILSNDQRKFGKITFKEKEIPSKKEKNYKRDLILYLNHQAQYKKRKIKITEAQATINKQ